MSDKKPASVSSALVEAERAAQTYEREIAGETIDSDKTAARNRLEAARKAEVNDMRQVLQSTEGRRLMWRILAWSGPMHGSFNADTHITAFNEGKRDVGIQLLELINAADQMAYIRMQNEHVSDLKSKKPKGNQQ